MKSEFIMSGGWDLSHHINWANQTSIALKEGVLYPDWMSGSNGGYGSPTAIFYSMLFHRLVGIVNLFVPSLVLSLKIVTFAGFLFSGLAMFMFLRNFCGHAASVGAGIAYQLFPYHLFELYVRESLSETFAFIWLPLVMHFVYKGTTEGGCRNWISLSLSYASLILTHNASAYMFTYVVAAFSIFIAVKEKSPGMILKFSIAIFFGLVLSAVYFIPMVFERRFVHMEWMINGPWGDYKENFLFLMKNRNSSFYNILETVVILQALVSVISFMLVYYKSRHVKISNFPLLVFFFSIFSISFFMVTPLSSPVWRILPERELFVFPWRWVIVSTFASSILFGLASQTVSLSDIKSNRFNAISIGILYAVVAGNLYFSSISMTKVDYLQEPLLERMLSKGNDLIEYRPVWILDKNKDFSKERRTYVTFKEGRGMIDIVSWMSQSRLFRIDAKDSSTLRVSTFYYPGWTAFVNGREVPVLVEKDSGAILLNIQPGESTILLEFRDTPLRRGAKWISVISLIAAFTGLIAAKRNRVALF